MGLTCKVGGARDTFGGDLAAEVAGLLDSAFGDEGDWEGFAPRDYGTMVADSLTLLQARAAAELGASEVPNLLAMGPEGRGVYLPAHVRAVSLPLSAGGPLRCASLPGLRTELAALAEHWDLPIDDEPLADLLRVSLDGPDGFVADDPEVMAYARLALAANEAVRRDCPLWLVG